MVLFQHSITIFASFRGDDALKMLGTLLGPKADVVLIDLTNDGELQAATKSKIKQAYPADTAAYDTAASKLIKEDLDISKHVSKW